MFSGSAAQGETDDLEDDDIRTLLLRLVQVARKRGIEIPPNDPTPEPESVRPLEEGESMWVSDLRLLLSPEKREALDRERLREEAGE